MSIGSFYTHFNMNEIRNIAFCAHCGNTAPQKLVLNHSCREDGYNNEGIRSEGEIPVEYYVAVCETCNAILLYYDFGGTLDEKDFTSSDLVYPKKNEMDASVPASVKSCYSEADRIKNLAPNAYAVLIRRALEAICDDRSVGKGSLQQRLQILAERGELPANLVEMTTVLRLLGNIGAHGVTQGVTVPDAWAMDGFFWAIIEYVYIAPKRLKEFRRSLEKRKFKINKEGKDE